MSKYKEEELDPFEEAKMLYEALGLTISVSKREFASGKVSNITDRTQRLGVLRADVLIDLGRFIKKAKGEVG